MNLRMSNGKSFNILWIGGPVGPSRAIMLSYYDSRSISEIASDFENVEKYEYYPEDRAGEVYEGYTLLSGVNIDRNDNVPSVTITLNKP